MIFLLVTEFLNNHELECVNFKVGDYFKLRIYFNCRRIVKKPIFTVSLFNIEGLLVSTNYSNFYGYNIDKISGGGFVHFTYLIKLVLQELYMD